MRPLPIPQIAVSDVLTDCIAGAENTLKPRLEAIRVDLDALQAAYDVAARGKCLHTLARGQTHGTVSTNELAALYETHLSATRGSARRHYDMIRNSAPNMRCPLCGAGTVTQVDHHLPKSRYPDLAIMPINLVPVCKSCNEAKKAKYPSCAGEQTLHPYYDGNLAGRWLTATVDRGPPVTVIFDVVTPPGWSKVDGQRAKRHFTVCGLAVNYASNAADELIPIREALVDVWSSGGALAVTDHLADRAHHHRLRPNSWQHALYVALAADQWFTDGGFRQIPH